nr:MAG: glycoprotein [Hangzhou sesamia inferens peribunyavirus 1]
MKGKNKMSLTLMLYVAMYFILQTKGNPASKASCYPTKTKEFTCCDSIEFMKNEYGNCMRSDTKYLQVVQEIRGNDTCFKYIYFKYYEIDLVQSETGYIYDYVISCTDIKMETFRPKNDCILKIDKVGSTLKLETESKMIALIKTEITTDLIYFENYRSIPLDKTCNNLEVYCGKTHKTIKFCHKEHLECKNLLSSYYFPDKISKYICPNLTLILFCLILLLVFKVSSILVHSHFYLILFPIYYPICLLVYYLYEKICKSCNNCGKPAHPFYKCNLTCTCGAIFNSTATLKRHKSTQKCKYAKLTLVKSCLFNKVFQFLNNIVVVSIFFLMILPSINAMETQHLQTEHFKWQHKVKQYLNHFSNGLEKDGFQKVAGALQNYKNDKSVILTKNQDTVLLDISAKPFETTKITIYYKDNIILQMGVTIEKSTVESEYIYQYTTGNTKHFKVNHDEICTGTCPNIIVKDGWVPFQKEATSYWGCEEFGCLASGAGCVWGTCDDIIDTSTVGKVYKKASNIDKTVLHVCIYMLNDGYCKYFNDDTLVHTGFKLQLINNDANFLPTKIYMDKKKDIFTGEINSIGEYDAKCGQLQVINGTNFGKPSVLFDILCFAIGKKGVRVRQCRETSHHSCLQLENIQKNGATSSYKSGSLYLRQDIKDGFIKFQMDVLPYLQIAETIGDENVKLSISGSCSGCVGCSIGINCMLQISSNMNTMCRVSSKLVSPSLEHIVISKGTHGYNIISYLKNFELGKKLPTNIDLKICETVINLSSIIKIDTNNMENSEDFDKTTINQGDGLCNNAFCQILSSFGSIFSYFSSFGTTVKLIIYVLLAFMILWIFLCLVMPIIQNIQNKIKHS